MCRLTSFLNHLHLQQAPKALTAFIAARAIASIVPLRPDDPDTLLAGREGWELKTNSWNPTQWFELELRRDIFVIPCSLTALTADSARLAVRLITRLPGLLPTLLLFRRGLKNDVSVNMAANSSCAAAADDGREDEEGVGVGLKISCS